MAFLTQLLLLGLGIFLMIVILLQRGRGGGLAGAFGGLGGQSAFGTKAGDVFTRITIVLAVAWVIVAGGSGYFLRAGAEQRASGLGEAGAGISAGELPEEDDEFDALPDTGTLPAGSAPADTAPATGTEATEDAAGTDAAATPAPEGSTPASPDAAPGDDAGDDSAAAPETEAPTETPESSDESTDQ